MPDYFFALAKATADLDDVAEGPLANLADGSDVLAQRCLIAGNGGHADVSLLAKFSRRGYIWRCRHR